MRGGGANSFVLDHMDQRGNHTDELMELSPDGQAYGDGESHRREGDCQW